MVKDEILVIIKKKRKKLIVKICKCENGWRMESVRRDFKDVLLRYEGGIQIND